MAQASSIIPGMSSSIKKFALYSISIILGLLLLLLGAWAVVAGPSTVGRIVRYGDTQIDDFLYFPYRSMPPSSQPYRFEPAVGTPRLPLHVEQGETGPVPLEEVLVENDSIAFLVLQEGNLVYESYFQNHTQDSLSQAFSMAKSWTSALIGIAIDDGLIRSVEQPVTDFIPELAVRGFDEVQIHHLLTMTSGSDYVENDNPFGIHVILNYTPRLEQRILSFEMERPPGEHFRYKSGDNALLALALDRALGERTITDYTRDKLWEPLGMQSEGRWSLDHAGDGLEKTWCCLAAAARDFIKLGQLYLQSGEWQGKQIVSSEWVAASTQRSAVPATDWDPDLREASLVNYGYQWWILDGDEGEYLALGKDGQYLYVNPSREIAILRLGWSTGELFTSGWIEVFRSVAEQVGAE